MRSHDSGGVRIVDMVRLGTSRVVEAKKLDVRAPPESNLPACFLIRPMQRAEIRPSMQVCLVRVGSVKHGSLANQKVSFDKPERSMTEGGLIGNHFSCRREVEAGPELKAIDHQSSKDLTLLPVNRSGLSAHQA